MNVLFRQLGESFRRPEFWAYSGWLDILTRYRRTRLGIVWLFAPVLMLTLVIGPLFAELMGRELEVFLVHFGIGHAVWRMLSMVMSESTSMFNSNKAFIMDGNVVLTDFTLKVMAKAVFYFAFAMVGMLGVLFWSSAVSLAGIPTLFLTVPVIVLNLFWIAHCFGILGARYPDFSQLLNTILMAGFMFTPIIWEGERFPADTLAGFVVRINPAFHLLELVRAPLYGRLPSPGSALYVFFLTILGWTLTALLSRRYSRFVPIWI